MVAAHLTVPKPSSLADGLTCKYDAWNRLVKVEDGETTVAELEYDGLGRRIRKKVGTLDRHYIYSNRWQVLEERIGFPVNANRQYVWGTRYIDDLILRDRNVVAGGDLGKTGSGLDERMYCLQDPNWNVAALAERVLPASVQKLLRRGGGVRAVRRRENQLAVAGAC